MTDTVQELCQYGFTEILNNVVAHSRSPAALISIHVDAVNIRMMVSDSGVGIFNRIQQEFGTDDARHSLLELSKGKLTSCPDRLAGDGLYFTSQMYDRFSILSGDLFYRRSVVQSGSPDRPAIEVEKINRVPGTAVFMDLHPGSKRTVQKVLNSQSGDGAGPGFHTTHLPVILAKKDREQLVSRSQAKRLLARLDRFKDIYLDFNGLATIGQSFADEIFRVYLSQHPQIKLHPINTQAAVAQMIQRVRSNSAGAA